MKNTFVFKTIAIATGVMVATLFLLSSILSNLQLVGASAPSGLYSTVKATSTASINPTATSTLVASSTNCAARVISTSANIYLTFTDEDQPSATNGIYQPANTAEIYDGGIYGCDTIKAYAVATATVNTLRTE